MRPIFVAVMLLGCQSHSRWAKPAPADWDRDTYECERDARMVGQTNLGPRPTLDYDLYEKCLLAHGWKKLED